MTLPSSFTNARKSKPNVARRRSGRTIKVFGTPVAGTGCILDELLAGHETDDITDLVHV